MKLTKFSKKIIAIVSAFAMIIAGIVYVPNTAKADDYSALTFTDITNNANNEFNQNLKGSQKAINAGSTFSTLNVCQYQNAGFSELYIAGPWSAAGLAATVNGVADSVTVEGAGLRIYNAADYLTKRYNVIKVTTTDGTDGEIIIFCPEIPDEEPSSEGPDTPTVTAEPTTTTEATTAEPTTASAWVEIGGGAANQWYYNNETKQNISNVVNIQHPGWADEDGVYITVPAGISQVDVNGVTQGVAAIDGAGFVVYLSALTKKINEVTVTQGLGTSKIQIKNENGSDDPTEEPSEEPSVEPSTEAPSESSETPSEEPQQEWISALGKWVHRQADGSFIYEDGADYNAVQGITALWSGNGAEVEVSNDTADLYTLPINVIRSAQGDWSTQVHINKEGLDTTKVYDVTLKAGDTTVYEGTAANVAAFRTTVNLAGKLAVGQTTLTLEVEEQQMPPEPEVQNITINPLTADIQANHNIWANWTNPTGTTKAYVYLEQVDNAHAAALLNNAWIFNDNAAQPMVGVDKVAQTRDGSVVIEEGQTYTLIVESYDAWNRQTGYGEVEITIPGLTPEEREVQEYLAKINTTENLALGKTPIVAEGNNENTANNIVDGNNGSRWQANKAIDNTYFGVDLGALYSIDKVLVSWEASNATSYEIYAAGNDGVYGDTPVATVSGLDNNKAVVKLSKNIGAEARYIKVVVTGWSGNASGYGISPYELAVFGTQEGFYDVSEYKSTTPYTYPTEEGKIFAGWFTDDTCTTPYTGTTGNAYAKFIDAKVLTVKFQNKNDGTAVRFLSTIDDSDYNKVGFIFTGTYGNATITEKTKECNYVYSSIVAAGVTETASEAFENNDSAYFFTYVVKGMDPEVTSRTFNVKAFYETLDGTTVIGPANNYPPQV